MDQEEKFDKISDELSKLADVLVLMSFLRNSFPKKRIKQEYTAMLDFIIVNCERLKEIIK